MELNQLGEQEKGAIKNYVTNELDKEEIRKEVDKLTNKVPMTSTDTANLYIYFYDILSCVNQPELQKTLEAYEIRKLNGLVEEYNSGGYGLYIKRMRIGELVDLNRKKIMELIGFVQNIIMEEETGKTMEI